jgi:hypothetical protein
LENQVRPTDNREEDYEDETLWMKPRDAFREFGISVPWLHALASKDPSPLITKVVTTGRIRTELRIWRPSLEAYLKREGTVESDEDWGRQVIREPALAS